MTSYCRDPRDGVPWGLPKRRYSCGPRISFNSQDFRIAFAAFRKLDNLSRDSSFDVVGAVASPQCEAGQFHGQT
jgi:hypothetical protein